MAVVQSPISPSQLAWLQTEARQLQRWSGEICSALHGSEVELSVAEVKLDAMVKLAQRLRAQLATVT